MRWMATTCRNLQATALPRSRNAAGLLRLGLPPPSHCAQANNAAFIFSLSLPPSSSSLSSSSLSLLPGRLFISIEAILRCSKRKKQKFLDSDAERQMRDEFHSNLSRVLTFEEDENERSRKSMRKSFRQTHRKQLATKTVLQFSFR